MCGIVGLMSNKSIDRIEDRIEKMNSAIIHRGPEAGKEVIIDMATAFGHRRLAIIETTTGANQPMYSNSGRWIVTFNGEIYNYLEIEKELDYTFKSKSDTEVIVGAVEEKGIEWFLERAIGMFSIGLYDNLEKKLYLIRDRLGIKPLYYSIKENTIAFASEIKGILASGLYEAIFNEDAVDEYLGNRYIREPYTFFKDIYQIKSGYLVEIDKNLNIKEKKYWDLPKEFNYDEHYDEEECIRGLREEIVNSIKRRLIADVPLGTYLSGGVDSSLITAITALEKNDKINTYTIGFEELNEFEYANVVAEKYNTNHHTIKMTNNDYLNKWEEIIRFKDSPLGVPNEIPLAIMSQKLKEKITVVLSGEGADELLGGYGRIFRAAFDYENDKKNNKTFYEYFIDKYEYVGRDIRDKYLNVEIKYRSQFDKEINNMFEGIRNEENIFRFFHKYHVKGLLQRVDITTMLTAVEARVPFLDHTLIEYVYKNIPYDLKLKWNSEESIEEAKKITSDIYSEKLDIPKYILKKIAYDYLPKEVIERKKMGFPVPLTDWFGDLQKMANELLINADWLRKDKIGELIIESKNNIRAGQVLWMFINIEMFRKIYFNKSWVW